MKSLWLLILVLITTQAFAQSKDRPDSRREKIIGNILKNALETYHYKGMKINDEVSQKAFVEYLKKIDSSKQLLTKGDIKELEAYQNQMDDQMVNGDYALVEKALGIMKKRIDIAEAQRK